MGLVFRATWRPRGSPPRAVAVKLLPMLLSACSSGSRTQIRIVGSSTVYPFTTAVAEQFKRKWQQFPAPIVESILSSGGVIVPPDGYLKALVERARKRGLLIIVDEAQTGLGRTGRLFDCEHDGIVPDFITLSKTLGAGLPLSAVLTTPEIEDKCFENKFHFYTTHASDPLPAAVGLKVIEIILRDRLAERAKVAGNRLRQGFDAMMQRYEIIGDVRGRGLLMGVELVRDRRSKTPAPELAQRIMNRCLDLGMSTSIIRGTWGVFRIAPPITISDADIDLGLTIFEQALRETVATARS
jgi:2,2-dialkylglycine decarboxylase (pyruvate)